MVYQLFTVINKGVFVLVYLNWHWETLDLCSSLLWLCSSVSTRIAHCTATPNAVPTTIAVLSCLTSAEELLVNPVAIRPHY